MKTAFRFASSLALGALLLLPAMVQAQSGNGRELGRYGLEEFLVAKSLQL